MTSALALAGTQSVHVAMASHIIYVRRSYKEATAADVSDEMQEAACRAILPAGAAVRVISDSGGHNSGHTAARDGYQALLAAVAAGQVSGIIVYDLSRLFRNARLMLDLAHELERRQIKHFLYENLYFSPALEGEKDDAERIIGELFAHWTEEPDDLPRSYREKAVHEPLPRVICDYIAGMTDPFISQQYEKYCGA